jgi:hypothetical protein
MEVRPGTLYAAIEIVALVDRYDQTTEEFTKSFPFILTLRSDEIVDFALEMGWAIEGTSGLLANTARGREIARLTDPKLARRQQLIDIVAATMPAWAKALLDGRAHFKVAASPDVKQCFGEAELLDQLDQDAIQILDQMQSLVRGDRENENLRTGRMGERLTVAYEEDRTGAAPKWTSIETNRDGYDVLSRRSTVDAAAREIEVKATTRSLKDAEMILTRAEWDKSSGFNEYTVHCWLIREFPRLMVLSRADLVPHIPKDHGAGEWRQVRIPFLNFANCEVDVPVTVGKIVAG